jgi:hypothetical protein
VDCGAGEIMYGFEKLLKSIEVNHNLKDALELFKMMLCEQSF